MMVSRTIQKAQALFAIPGLVAQAVTDYLTQHPVQPYTDEQARDAVGATLRAPAGMAWQIDDPSDLVTLALTDQAAFRQAIGARIGQDVQGWDADLAAIAALTTTAFGRSVLTTADAVALRALTQLGTAAQATVGYGAGQLAPLDGNGKVLASTLPAIATDDKYVVASQAAMLATGAQLGDIAIRTDQGNRRYILLDTDPTVLASWSRVLTPTDTVLSLAGLYGDITDAQVRAALALVVGTNVQAWDADLDALAAIAAQGVVLVRTANGIKPATLSGITLGGTADAPVLTAAASSAMREQTFTVYDTSLGTNQNQHYYAVVSQSVVITAISNTAGANISFQKSTAAAPKEFGVSTTVTAGNTSANVALEAGATLRITSSGNSNFTWAHVRQVA